MKKFKVGETVKILGKTVDERTNEYNNPINKTPFRIGDMVKITGIGVFRSSGYTGYIVEGLYDFAEWDLESIKSVSKWEIKRPLTLVELIEKSRITTDELRNILMNDKMKQLLVGSPRVNILTTALIEYAEKHSCFIKFLVENKYIKKVEQTYKFGDKFKKGRYVIMLCVVGFENEIVAVVVEDDMKEDEGKMYNQMKYKVIDVYKITKDELHKILPHGSIDSWEKV